MSKKILIVLSVFALFGVASYFFIKISRDEKSSEMNTTSQQKEDLMVYEDKLNKFKFTYSSKLEIKEDKSDMYLGSYSVSLTDKSILDRCISNIICPLIKASFINEKFEKNSEATYTESTINNLKAYESRNIPNIDGFEVISIFVILNDNSFMRFELINEGVESDSDKIYMEKLFREVSSSISQY